MRPARPDERTDGIAHEYCVSYPSGNQFQGRAIFARLTQHDGISCPTLCVDDQVWVLDPRAVITRNGLVIDEPRRWAGHLGLFDDWLDEHPEWPRILFDTAETP